MLNKYGRRNLLLFWNSVIIVLLFIMSLSTVYQWSGLLLGTTTGFMMCFVFAPGPITWIYMNEVMNYKGVAAGTAINWSFELIIGLISKPMFDHP